MHRGFPKLTTSWHNLICAVLYFLARFGYIFGFLVVFLMPQHFLCPVFYGSYFTRHTCHNSTKLKSDHMPTTDPTKYLRQYSADEDIWRHHPLRMHGGQMQVPFGCTYLLPLGLPFMVKQQNMKKNKFYTIRRLALTSQVLCQFGEMWYHFDPLLKPTSKHPWPKKHGTT